MHPALSSVDHRPWPLPPRPWTLRMTWLDLAFIHYRIDPSALALLLPTGLRVDEFDGSAWIGLVPFRMANVAPRPLPNLPGLSAFPEVNVRTYVDVHGKPGVWFFSLDADSWPAVFGGQRFFNLPYFSARMQQTERGGWFDYASVRLRGPGIFRGRYRPTGEVFLSRPGTFEHWATERYCLYAHSPRRGLARLEVHHARWPLQTAEAEIADNTLFAAAGLTSVADAAPICHFSRGVDVISFNAERIS